MTLICIFVLILFPMAIHLRQIFEAILFGVVGLSCIIYLIVKRIEPKEMVKISESAVQLNYLGKTVTINLINIDKVEFKPVISLKRHVPIPESYGSLTIYAQDKKYYMDEVEDVEEVYEVIKAYVNNKKELM